MKKKKKQNSSVQNVLFDLAENHNKKVYPVIHDEEREKLLLALLALNALNGVGFKTLCTLFDRGLLTKLGVWSQDELVDKWRETTGNYALDLAQNFAKDQSRLLKIGIEAASALAAKLISFIPIGHRDYPTSLFRLANPPRWLFVKGSIEAIKSSSIVAIIGTRSATVDGQRLAYLSASILARRNITVLSGLAPGIDVKAHLGAVDYYGVTIAVLGVGINLLDSKENEGLITRIIENDGALISEYLPDDPGTRNSFLRRNELQAALSRVVIPIECPKLESGTGATIRRALNINTPIIGVSKSINSIDEKNLITTRENLLKLGAPIFSLNNGEQIQFWNFLNRNLPDHNWQETSMDRQSRFFRVIEKEIIKAKKKLDLDSTSIDRLADQLKKVI